MKYMAKATIKISDMSRDFGMKAKDVIEGFKSINIEKNSGASVSDVEFEAFMQHMTFNHQIHDLAAYEAGKITITAPTPKKAEPKPAPKPQVKAEPKPEPKPEVKAEPKPEAKPGIKAQPTRPVQDRPETRPQGQRPQGGYQGQGPRPQGQPYGQGRGGAQGQGQRPQGGYQQGQRPQGGYQGQRYGQRPSDDPFAKRRENMNRNAEGRPQGGYQGQGQRPQGGQTARPVAPTAPAPARPEAVAEAARVASTQRPAQKAHEAQLERRQKAQEAAQAKQPTTTPTKREEKRAPAQRQQLRTITVERGEVKGGVNIGADAPTTTPGRRVIDTRTTDVDLSKYDERYNDQYYAIANGTDRGGHGSSKVKIKRQDNRTQGTKSAKERERANQERIRRMEMERARSKQLEITIPDEITVSELAIRLKKTSAEVIKKLMMMGEMKSLNDVIDYATAEIIADEFGAKVTREVVVTIEEKLFTEAEDNDEDLVERAPVVCVMGHVDHGKTSILDAIRHTNVTKGEAGGITQAIGAYRVKVNGKDITFLDTPGHEAFTAMRMRGAKSTDIAILVVAADDGVMPQTIEAINHAKAAGIDIIVAINKMDKQHANPDNVLNQLTQYELVPEAWGGDVITVPVSALTGMGIDDLLESVLLVAEVKELRANPAKRARGIVIESKLDRGRGPVATVLVQNGTLHQGDYVIVGNATGRVRAMVDDKGRTVKVAGPSVPVEIIGLDDVPQAGDELNAVEDERMARDLAEQRRERMRQEILAANARVNLDDLFSRIAEGTKSLNIIVKADVAGSAEAVKASLLKLSNDEVKVNVIHSAVGGITESDVMLAAASDAIIVGFSVRPDKNALDSAERNNVDIRTHRIIYEIIDEVEAAMKGMLAPTFREVILGHAEVRQTIRVPNVGIIAGCYVQDGKITRQASIRIVRDGVVIFEDKIASLRRFKDDVKEVADGYECGVGIDKFNDIREGDIFEAFIMEEVARS